MGKQYMRFQNQLKNCVWYGYTNGKVGIVYGSLFIAYLMANPDLVRYNVWRRGFPTSLPFLFLQSRLGDNFFDGWNISSLWMWLRQPYCSLPRAMLTFKTTAPFHGSIHDSKIQSLFLLHVALSGPQQEHCLEMGSFVVCFNKSSTLVPLRKALKGI